MDKNKIVELWEAEGKNITKAAERYAKENGLEYKDSLRRNASRIIGEYVSLMNDADETTTETTTETKQYKRTKDKEAPKMSALNPDNGSVMTIEEYCQYYGMDYSKVRSFKLVTHTGTPYYNIAFYNEVIEPQVTEAEFKAIISDSLKEIPFWEPLAYTGHRGTGVVKIADLHLGAYVDGLIKTKKFSIDILAKKLRKAAEQVNSLGYRKVHAHILGDLIESFTGLSHKNTWKGLDKKMAGAEAVKLTVKVLHDNFLSQIHNLDTVKIVAGNHDRVTSDNKEDVYGDAAAIISWGLDMLGYDVQFDPLVISHTIDGICHILTHGHHGISQRTTKQLCWDYGTQGKYNLICEGHLHSIIQRLSVTAREKFQTIKDDAVDHRRINCPSFFTGNFYSESLGYTSESGFIVVEDNGEGVPNVFYYAV